MELKLSSFNLRLIITIRSNRTFMELKLRDDKARKRTQYVF